MKNKKSTTALFLVIMAVLATVSLFVFKGAQASINPQINYQGKLSDSSGQPITTAQDFTFRIYDDSSDCDTGNAAPWSESWTGGNQISPNSDGLFSVMLGTQTTIDLDFDESTTVDGYSKIVI